VVGFKPEICVEGALPEIPGDMRICVAYTVVTSGPISDQYAARFVETWHEYPGGIDSDLLIVCNGGPLRTDLSLIFAPLHAQMFPRSNEDMDLGGYVAAARGPAKDYDMLVCLGESVHFHREGWLKRLAEAWTKTGPGMYGPFASNLVRPHMNTTAFCTSPLLLQRCQISTHDRYGWEHGQNSFWRWVSGHGMPVRLVTWDGEWEPRLWRMPQNILWRGTQENCLMWCNHVERYRDATPALKATWSRGADAPFK